MIYGGMETQLTEVKAFMSNKQKSRFARFTE